MLDSASELLGADLLLLSETGFRQLFQLPPEVYTDAVLTVRNPREASTVASKSRSPYPPAGRFCARNPAHLRRRVPLARGMVFVTLGSLLLAFLILAWDKAAGLSAEENAKSASSKPSAGKPAIFCA